VAALNELDTAPDSTVGCETQVGAPLDLACHDDISAGDDAGGASDSIAEAEQQSDLLLPNEPRRDGKIRQGVRGLLKPLLAVATAQYALVTALAGITAYAVAANASKFVTASLEPIIAALKRL